ncbi:MAG: hypothetical protein HY718_04395 [Planctomycetes bacterium]|nr:hypothetical protein [Planctomycetota bacterium]
MNTQHRRRRASILFCAVYSLLVSWTAGPVHADILYYELSVGPDAEAVPMVKLGDGYGDLASGDFGPPRNAGLQGDGTARLVDSGTHGKDGYYIIGLGATFTVELRVKANGAVLPASGNDRRSMGIHDGGNGRGILIEPEGLTLVSGTGPVGGGFAAADLTSLHRIRLTVAGGQVTLYDLENDLDAGPGVNFAVLAGPVNLGGSGAPAEITTGGGLSINTLDVINGSSVQNSDYTLDWLRVDRGTALGASDDVIPDPPPLSCSSTVSPGLPQSSTAFQGEAATPPSFAYTMTNTGASAIDYSVQEVTASGAATDYDWLEAAPAGGNLPAGDDLVVTASIDTTGRVAGPYTGYLRFNDGCPLPAACVNETFSYANGALPGNGAWTGTAAAGEIEVLASEVKFSGGTPAGDASLAVNCGPDDAGTISIKVQVRSGAGDNTIGNYQVFDANGVMVGWCRLTGTLIRASNPLDAGAATPIPLNAANTELEMRINTGAKEVQYWYGGVLQATYPFSGSAVSTLGSIRFLRVNRTDVTDEYLFFDDLSVSIVEQYKLRRIDLTVIGCSIQVLEPRTRALGPCGGTSITTEVFTIRNDGAFEWTGFWASEFNDDDDWLTLQYTSAAVPRGGTATVAATIDWSLVPSAFPGDDQVGVIRFSATCDDGATFVSDTPPNTITLVDGMPQVIKYEGDVLPSEPDSGGLGSGISFVLVNDGSIEQGTIVSDPDALDGLAYRLQDTSLNKTKWRVTPDVPVTPAIGATIVGRIKTESAAGTPSANLAIYDTVISAALYWGGPNGIVREIERSTPVTIIGDGEYHVFRLTARDEGGANGIVVRAYVDENPTPVLNLTNAAGVDTGLGVDALGFGAGSTVGEQVIYFDCVYATSVGAFAPGEETACLGMGLVCESPCPVPAVDADRDHDVDMTDFAVVQECITIGNPVPPPLLGICACFDRNRDGIIDDRDVAAFTRCASGPDVPWEASVNCPN